jgi:hypothetical protein
MKLFIKVIDGQPVEHPNLESNLLQAFPEGIPSEYEPFERKETILQPGPFQTASSVYLKDDNGVWYDHWVITDFTDLQKQEKLKELEYKINLRIGHFKEVAKQGILVCMASSDLAGVNAFTQFLKRLEDYKLVSAMPVSPPMPTVPLKGEDGRWYTETNFSPLFNTSFYAPIEAVKNTDTTTFDINLHSILPPV